MLNKKILVLVDSININDSSGSKANVAIIANLAAAGFEVKVYHYTLKNIQLKGVNCYAIPEIKYSPLYFLSRFQRVVSRNFKVNFAPFLEQLFGFSFTFFNDVNSIIKTLKKCDFNPDLVLTLSKGGSFRPHYAMLKLPEYHTKWMAYVHDPYPFHYYPRPYTWVETSYKQKEKFFTQVSEKATYSAFPSQLLLEWMGSYFPNFLKTGIVIPHQISELNLNFISLPRFFDTSKFNLLHAGNLMKERSPKGLVIGFQLFLKNNKNAFKNARLILVGNAFDHTKMLTDFELETPELLVNTTNVPFEEVYVMQKNASVNIILESKSEISPFLPGKFPHCVDADRPILVLGPYLSETKRLLGTSYPYWAEEDDVEKIAKLIEKLYRLWKENPDNLRLNRLDLAFYLSENYLKKVMNELVTHN